MDMTRIVVPPVAGVFSALGLLFPETQHHHVRTCKHAIATAGSLEPAIEESFRALEDEGRRELAAEGYRDRVRIERQLDVRYAGENSELTVPCPPGSGSAEVAERFHAAHERTYGYHSTDEVVEVVNVRVIATGLAPASRVPERLSPVIRPGTASPDREAYFGPQAGWRKTPVVNRAEVPAGGRAGPLIVEDYDATTVVPPGAQVARAAWDALVIELES
jgi:N-methylhydantoinase A